MRRVARQGREFLEGRRVLVWVFYSTYLDPIYAKEWKLVPMP